MSFIRYNESGEYVEIPKGSMYYLYDDGSKIRRDGGSWTYEEFSAIILSLVDDLNLSVNEKYIKEMKESFFEYFDIDRIDDNYKGDIRIPEKAEIFCQFLDKRFDNMELDKKLQSQILDSISLIIFF